MPPMGGKPGEAGKMDGKDMKMGGDSAMGGKMGDKGEQTSIVLELVYQGHGKTQ